MHGTGVCYVHGGMSRKGIAHPNFKTGRYSKYLPRRLARRYREAASDTELLSVGAETALLQTRIGDLLSRLNTRGGGTSWERLREAWASVDAAMRAGEVGRVEVALADLGRLIEQGASDEETWREVADLIDRKARVAAKEWKRLVDLRQVITLEEGMALITGIMDAVVTNVADAEIRARIANQVNALIG
jgi:hypothetical protein